MFDRTEGLDGFVSLEVSPYLALKEEDTIKEARRLWKWVERPNLMVKVPGTDECVPAIRTLIGDGMNINVTLLFSIDAYKAVAEAYVSGLEDRHAKGEDISRISSVAASSSAASMRRSTRRSTTGSPPAMRSPMR